MRRLQFASAAALLLCATGCVTPYVVPEPLYRQVDQGVGFSQLRQDAGRHKGASVMLGGAVISARILAEGTEIEVLQLALDASDRPTGAYENSEGRFLLIDPERRDPVALQNRLITVVGEVVGTKVQKLDEVEYSYPYLSARFIHVWRGASGYSPDAAYPYYYPYYYPAYNYYPYGPYYPYYYDPFFWSGSFYYHGYYGPSGGSGTHGPSQRRFESPEGAGSPAPSFPAPSSPGGGGGGGGRRFK